MVYKILIQPAKSSISTCKNCAQKIQKNSLRAKVVDATQFNAYIQNQGRQNLQGEGLYRGYFQCVGPNGQHISIQKYFVHLDCYKPIEPHPYEPKYFDLKGVNKQQRKEFTEWLTKRANQCKNATKKKSLPKTKSSKPKQKASVKKEKNKKPSKTKKIVKKVNKKSKTK